MTIRFYEELNDFLLPERRGTAFLIDVPPACTVKAAIEDLGVPHTEVDLVLADGASVGFDHRVLDGERIAVFPVFESWDISGLSKVRPVPLREVRFIVDVHLGTLAGYLRMFGFDTRVSGARGDEELARLSRQEGRILLTRDRGLLKRRIVTHGLLVRSLVPRRQLAQVFERFELAGPVRSATGGSRASSAGAWPAAGFSSGSTRAWSSTRCRPALRETFSEFSRCAGCGKVFWRGTHWEGMRRLAEETLGRPLNGRSCGLGSPLDGIKG